MDSNTKYVPYIEHLRSLGCDSKNHSGRTLLRHLIGVAEILQRWAPDDEVLIIAGLYHSVYGTQFYRQRSASNRSELIEKLGIQTEWLVFVFCNISRHSIIREASCKGRKILWKNYQKGTVEVTAEEFKQLILLLWANELEERVYRRENNLLRPRGGARSRWYLNSYKNCAKFLPQCAMEELTREYSGIPYTLADKFQMSFLNSSDFCKTYCPSLLPPPEKHWRMVTNAKESNNIETLQVG